MLVFRIGSNTFGKRVMMEIFIRVTLHIPCVK